jgi:hypothetical protein
MKARVRGSRDWRRSRNGEGGEMTGRRERKREREKGRENEIERE